MTFQLFKEMLRRLIDDFDTSIFKAELKQSEVLNRLNNLSAEYKEHVEDLEILFDDTIREETGQNISKNKYVKWKWDFTVDNWVIEYNVYLDSFIFERIMETDDIQRIIEIKAFRANLRVSSPPKKVLINPINQPKITTEETKRIKYVNHFLTPESFVKAPL